LVELVQDALAVILAVARWAHRRLIALRDTLAKLFVEESALSASHLNPLVDIGADDIVVTVPWRAEVDDLRSAENLFSAWVAELLLAVGAREWYGASARVSS